MNLWTKVQRPSTMSFALLRALPTNSRQKYIQLLPHRWTLLRLPDANASQKVRFVVIGDFYLVLSAAVSMLRIEALWSLHVIESFRVVGFPISSSYRKEGESLPASKQQADLTHFLISFIAQKWFGFVLLQQILVPSSYLPHKHIDRRSFSSGWTVPSTLRPRKTARPRVALRWPYFHLTALSSWVKPNETKPKGKKTVAGWSISSWKTSTSHCHKQTLQHNPIKKSPLWSHFYPMAGFLRMPMSKWMTRINHQHLSGSIHIQWRFTFTSQNLQKTPQNYLRFA